MFLKHLRTFCDEADWIIKCGRTLDGYKANYKTLGGDVVADIYDSDINALYTYAGYVVAAGRRSSVRQHRWIADALVIVIDQHSAAEIIDTFAGII